MATVTTPEPGVIALEGEIDLNESPRVRETLQPMIDARTPRIIVDMAEVTYIDSSGLALFIEALQRTQAYGGQFRICGLRPTVRAIFDIARLDQVFRIYPDRPAAAA
jgi:anti-sigma B factor antagonist